MMKKHRGIVSLFLFFIFFSISGCASTYTAPLPATLNITPPSPDVPPEIAAFSGMWEGKWVGALYTILVVEKINTETAEVIYSTGEWMCCKAGYIYVTAKVLPGPTIEWINPEGNRFFYNMNDDLNSISGFIEEKSTGSKWWNAYMTRIKKTKKKITN